MDLNRLQHPPRELAQKLWSKFSRTLRAFIAGRVADPVAVDDLLQDIFIKIHAGIGTVRDNSKIKGWMYQIARNAIIDYYRSHKATVEFNEQSHHGGDGGEDDATATLASSLREMVEKLPEPYREAVIMTELEGLTQKELASRAGISLSGAKSRVQRGRNMLKDMLLNCCHFEFDSRGRIIEYCEHCCCCASGIPAT